MSGRTAGRRNDAGFSLTELMVASLVMILITTALFSSLEQTEVLYEDYAADMDLRQQARVALSQMGDEVRALGFDMGNLTEALTVATDSQLQFVGDLDDGAATGACDAGAEGADGGGAERVTYTFDGEAGTLRRQVDCWNGGTWTVNLQDTIVLRGLGSGTFLFRYFDRTGTRIPLGGGPLDEGGRGDVRSMSIEIGLSDDAADDLLGDGRTALEMTRHVKLQNRAHDE